MSNIARITSTHSISVDEIGDNTSEPSLSAKDRYQIFQLICDANNDACPLREVKAGTHSAAGSAGDGDSPSNKKTTIISHLTACAHLLCKACGPKFAEEFGGVSASVGYDKPFRRNRPLCGEYVKPSLLDIKSG